VVVHRDIVARRAPFAAGFGVFAVAAAEASVAVGRRQPAWQQDWALEVAV
jgi:hypothetical protein